jgi:hypothetical protein
MMRLFPHRLCLLALAPLAACGGAGGASIPPDDPPEGSAAQADTIQCPVPPPTTCADNNPLKNAYFGDLHSHTSFSLDAYGFGTRAGPAQAYAFASNPNGTANPQDAIAIASGAASGDLDAGLPETPGPTVTIDRPLDFLAVTDHSEFFNVDYGCTVDSGSGYYNSAYCATLRNAGSAAQGTEILATLDILARTNPMEPSVCQGGSLLGGSPAQCAAEEAAAWTYEQQATACAYDPCTFTSLYAYEWTATTNNDNLHRNVIFGSAQVPTMPFDYIDYPTPHALWNALSTQCTGACSAITIPHNSNLSGGQMFAPPTTAQDLAYMVQYQRLAEIHQHRGNSECFYDPADGGTGTNGGSSDPNCAFETLPGTNNATDAPGYVRNALECGLTYFAGETGSQCVGGAGVAAAGPGDPFQLGIVGATDTHNATPGNTVENPRLATPGSDVPVDFPGHFGVDDDEPILRVQGCAQGDSSCTGTANINQGYNPGGLTGVWAEQNTRDRIFAALERREVFGTSGTRIKLRFYAYTGSQSPCSDSQFPQQVVASGGVPMGGTVGSAPAGGLSFVVQAAQDATPLAEVDIIKASVINGVIQEQIVDNIQFNQEGQGVICATWTDSTYVPTAPAFYYARVLEQPVPRWSTYDCAAVAGSTDIPECVTATSPTDTVSLIRDIQERAWSSPIWNLP